MKCGIYIKSKVDENRRRKAHDLNKNFVHLMYKKIARLTGCQTKLFGE